MSFIWPHTICCFGISGDFSEIGAATVYISSGKLSFGGDIYLHFISCQSAEFIPSFVFIKITVFFKACCIYTF